MAKYLVSFKIGSSREVWIEHADIDASIQSRDYNVFIKTARRLTKEHLGINSRTFDQSQINDGTGNNGIELWNYKNGAQQIKRVEFDE